MSPFKPTFSKIHTFYTDKWLCFCSFSNFFLLFLTYISLIIPTTFFDLLDCLSVCNVAASIVHVSRKESISTRVKDSDLDPLETLSCCSCHAHKNHEAKSKAGTLQTQICTQQKRKSSCQCCLAKLAWTTKRATKNKDEGSDRESKRDGQKTNKLLQVHSDS